MDTLAHLMVTVFLLEYVNAVNIGLVHHARFLFVPGGVLAMVPVFVLDSANATVVGEVTCATHLSA
jgi:putative effector of murein hydrolase LrgA (UPF0299 family)